MSYHPGCLADGIAAPAWAAPTMMSADWAKAAAD